MCFKFEVDRPNIVLEKMVRLNNYLFDGIAIRESYLKA